MRILANENIPQEAIAALRSRGHDVKWIRTAAPGVSDKDVLTLAINEERILITFDKDFGELALHAKLPAKCGIILLRIPIQSSRNIAELILSTIESRTDWEGCFSVIEEQRIRMRPLL
jgi:predicted nuclease of predicted toxin-antitoxin system